MVKVYLGFAMFVIWLETVGETASNLLPVLALNVMKLGRVAVFFSTSVRVDETLQAVHGQALMAGTAVLDNSLTVAIARA